MKVRNRCFGVLVIAVVCFASGDSLPFGGQIRAVDQLFKIAASGSDWPKGLDALEQIANGRPEDVDPAQAKLVGITKDATELSWFRASDVRAHAMRMIGQTGRQEAIAYLSSLRAADFDSATMSMVWHASQVALQQAHFLQIDNRPQKIEFLERLLIESGGIVASWAGDELCNMGSMPSLPLIAKSIRKRNPTQDGEGEIQFAEARIRAVTSDPDRAKALASALKISSDPNDERLIQWAVSQLVSMHTAAADAELKKYSTALEQTASPVARAKEPVLAAGEHSEPTRAIAGAATPPAPATPARQAPPHRPNHQETGRTTQELPSPSRTARSPNMPTRFSTRSIEGAFWYVMPPGPNGSNYDSLVCNTPQG